MSAPPSLQITVVPVTPFQQNCSIVRCETTGRGFIVDPGGDLDEVLAEVARLDVQIDKILVTHGHLDHAGATAELRRRLGVEVWGPHRDDEFWIQGLKAQGDMLGLPGGEPFVPDHWLTQGDALDVGALQIEVIHCPGHTPGHVVFFLRDARVAFVGDVLFQGSIGRTDFPRGSLPTLLSSIRERLFPLGDDVEFIPGHGPTSTFGEERLHNPFVSGRSG